MATYEIREDRTDFYYPFTVYVDGNPTKKHFGSQRGAQSWIDDQQYEDGVDPVMFNLLFGAEKPENVMSQPEPRPEKQVVFLDGPYEAGAIIADKNNHQYRVTQASYWLSEKDVADLEDGWDVTDQVGWRTPAELVEDTHV